MEQFEKQLNDFMKLEQILKEGKEIKSPILPFKIKIEKVEEQDKK